MGATDLFRSYETTSIKTLKTQIEQDTNIDIMEDGCSYSGSWGVKRGAPIILNGTASSYSEAEDKILDKLNKWDPVGAIQVVEKVGTPAQLERISKQHNTINQLRNDFYKMKQDSKIKFFEVKSKTKTCKGCGTRHVMTNLNSYDCPNCRESMLSDTVSKKHNKMLEKIDKAIIKVEDMISKKGGKTNKYYVAGGSCSC
jgi:predicted RNA-binding Zn-ribbon protein involved in translation (DUF1610 family)